MSSLVSVHKRGSLFQSNNCNLSLAGIKLLSILSGCLLKRGFHKLRVGCTCTCLNPFTPNIHLQVLHSQLLVEVNLREDLNSNSFSPSSPQEFYFVQTLPRFHIYSYFCWLSSLSSYQCFSPLFLWVHLILPAPLSNYRHLLQCLRTASVKNSS